ncbi:MAG: tail fiber protein [Anaerolineae bacterium]|nr:tail fiber protein [Anaerolineae bacterium]
MRSINATLLANQTSLNGEPCLSLVIGAAPNTINVSAYVLGYDYEEIADAEAGLTIYLDNKTGHFNTLTGSKAYITQGAPISLSRGLTVAGADYTAELPRTWIETISYTHEGGQQLFTLECIDWLGKLARWRASSIQTWTATSATTILEWILTQVGLTRASGSMTALSLDYAIRLHETGEAALDALVRKLPEYLYPGLDAEIKWKDIDDEDASVYTFGWNANHAMLNVEAGSSAWQFNSITVKGRGSYTGAASDATQIAAVGTRKRTIYDDRLRSNAACAQRAAAELDFYQAAATEGIIVCRPCHGLELLDQVTISSPPWGGSNTVGRVIRYTEQRDADGRWYQVIYLGAPPDKDPGKQPAAKKSSRKRTTRKSSSYSGILRRIRRLEELLRWIYDHLFDGEATLGLIPIGGIILWSGAVDDIPIGWALCDGETVDEIVTPDLRDKFVVGAGSTYEPDATGGADSVDLSHSHDYGTLATDAESTHTHDYGTLATDAESAHTHTLSSGNTGSGGSHSHDVTGASSSESSHTHSFSDTSSAGSSHTHSRTLSTEPCAHGSDHNVVQEVTIGNESAHTHTVSGATGAGSSHSHGAGSYATDTESSHTHSISEGSSGAGSSHSHTVTSGATGAGSSHSHTVASGATGAAGSTEHDNRPAYYALAYIIRVA